MAALSVWALALFPASFVFSMTYPSAIFLAASVWAFVLVEDRHDLAAGFVAVGCGDGAAQRSRARGGAGGRGVVVVAPGLVVAGPSVVGVLAWCIYCADRTGDPLVFLTTKSRWQEITFVGLFEGHVKWSVLPHVVLAVGALVVLVVQRKRLPLSWLVFGALVPHPVAAARAWSGVGRYANECFPPFVAAGQILERWPPRAWDAVFAVSTVGWSSSSSSPLATSSCRRAPKLWRQSWRRSERGI